MVLLPVERAKQVQESEIAAMMAAPATSLLSPTRPRYSDFINSLNFNYNLRLGLLGYGLDDQPQPRLHPFFDSEGSLRMKAGGRLFARDKKYTAGASIGGVVDFEPAIGSPMELNSVFVIVGGTKATPGTLECRKVSGGSLELSTYGSFNASANNTIRLPTLGIAATASGNKTESSKVTIWNPDKFRVTLATMVLNELFTVRQRWLVHGPDDPTITTVANLTEADE